MGQWVSSREFAEHFGFVKKSLEKACFRANLQGKKICSLKSNKLYFKYSHGIGGNASKVLRIWSEPFATEEAALAFIESNAYNQLTTLTTLTTPHKIGTCGVSNSEVGISNTQGSSNLTTSSPSTQSPLKQSVSKHSPSTQAENNTKALSCPSAFIQSAESKNMFDNKDADGQLRALDEFAKALQKDKNLALEKKSIIKEWERYRARGVNAKEFIALLNAGGEYSIPLSENKLYAWQRAYKSCGIDGLLEKRGKNRASYSKIKELGIENLTNKLILASRGRVNISSLHRMLHIHLDSLGRADLADFLAKRDEVISYRLNP